MTTATHNASAPKAAGKGSAASLSTTTANALDTAVASTMETHPAWATISSFPALLSVGVLFHQLRVRNLLALQTGQIIGTSWNCSDDVPLRLGGVQLAWGEFDVQNGRIALRLTHLV